MIGAENWRYRLIWGSLLMFFLLCGANNLWAKDSSASNPFGFFTNAISVPPDVEEAIVCQRGIGPQDEIYEAIQQEEGIEVANQASEQFNQFKYYRCARAATNFFLMPILYSNSICTIDESDSIFGRSKDSIYCVHKSSVTYGIGETAMVAGNRGLYYLVAQYLNLGIGDIEPGSVRWNGQHFTGSTTSGELRTGELEISNQIPTRLTIRNKYDEVVKAVEYSYPENWRENSGFPKRMVIMKTTSAGLQPHFEIIIEKITLARHKLTSASFAVTNFLTTNMAHVEIYFNQTLYAMDKNGHMRRVYGPIEKFQLNRGQTTSRKGFVIGALILIVITPVLLWLIPKMFKLKGAGS